MICLGITIIQLNGPGWIFFDFREKGQENLKKAKAAGKGVEITLSKAQLKKQGGILPFLIVPALIAAAKAAALGAAGAAGAAAVKGIADAVQSKKGSGFLKKHRKGRGLFVPGKR